MKVSKKRTLLREAGWIIEQAYNISSLRLEWQCTPPNLAPATGKFLLRLAWSLYKQGGLFRQAPKVHTSEKQF